MKSFEFAALNVTGQKKIGTVRARSLSEAKRKIQEKGFYLTSIRIQDSSTGPEAVIKREGIQRTVSESQRHYSLFQGLKELFFAREKIRL